MVDKAKISNGRVAVDSYRAAHAQLYAGGWHKGISEEHTPLLEKMLANFKVQGFNSLDEFFVASDQLNLEELGLLGKTKLTEADLEALEEKWH